MGLSPAFAMHILFLCNTTLWLSGWDIRAKKVKAAGAHSLGRSLPFWVYNSRALYILLPRQRVQNHIRFRWPRPRFFPPLRFLCASHCATFFFRVAHVFECVFKRYIVTDAAIPLGELPTWPGLWFFSGWQLLGSTSFTLGSREVAIPIVMRL